MVTTTTVPDAAGRAWWAWCGLILVLLARSYRAFVLTLLVAAMIPMLWNWTSYVVRSGSMEPAISVGDVIVGQPFSFSADSPVPAGRVMFFTPPSEAPRHDTIVHRVAENLGDGTYVTAGDANQSVDPQPVPAESFHHRAVICVPFIGLPVTWWASGDLVPLIAVLAITMAAFYFSSRPPCDPRHRRPGRKNAELAPDKKTPADRSRDRGRTILRRACLPVVSTLVAGVTLGMPTAQAGAAFNATTANAGSTWSVAVTTSRAASTFQVYDTPSASGWYQRGSVSVNVAATANGGPSIRSITYSINGAAPVTIRSSSIVLTVDTQGDNTITYFATDSAGASEQARTAHVKLDNTAPSLAVTSRTGDMTHAQWAQACPLPGMTGGVCGTTEDGVGSGVASVQYVLSRSSNQQCFDGSKWTGAACNKRPSASLQNGTWVVDVPDDALQTARTWYTVTVFVVDAAGNGTNTTRNFSVG